MTNRHVFRILGATFLASLIASPNSASEKFWMEELRNAELPPGEPTAVIKFASCLEEGVVFHSTRIARLKGNAMHLQGDKSRLYVFGQNQLRMLASAASSMERKMSLELYQNRQVEAQRAYQRLAKRENLDEIDHWFSIVDWALFDCGMAEKPGYEIFIPRYQ